MRFLRRNAVPLAVAFAAVLALIVGFGLFGREEAERYAAARHVLAEPSEVRLGLAIAFARGPIVEEVWALDDRDGVSNATYRIVGRDGETIRLDSRPHVTTDVSFAFERAVRDGIWELPSRPPRGDTSPTYTVSVYELTDGQHGGRSFHFTDPHYWATTGGHQFHLHLSRDKPLPDLLTLTSTVPVEPRYERLVADFRDFGSPELRAKIAQSRAKILTRTVDRATR